MSTELSRVAPAKQLTLPTRDITDLVTLYSNHVERETWNTTFIGVDIPPKDRTALSARLCHIDAVCVYRPEDSKFERARIDKAISFMISMFTVGRKISALEAQGTVKGYVIALEGVPAHFVEQAALDFAKGRVKDHDNAYTPTSAQVRARAEELMVPFREEAAKIRLIISSKKRIKPTPEEHQRMIEKTMAVINGTDPDIRAMQDRVKQEVADARVRQAMQVGASTEKLRRKYCAHHGVDPDGIASPSLIMKLNGIIHQKTTVKEVPCDDAEWHTQ